MMPMPMPMPIVMMGGGSNQDHGVTFTGFVLRVILLGIFVVAIMYILKHPKSPLRHIISPDSVPDVPFLPKHEKKSGVIENIVIVLFVLALLSVMVFGALKATGNEEEARERLRDVWAATTQPSTRHKKSWYETVKHMLVGTGGMTDEETERVQRQQQEAEKLARLQEQQRVREAKMKLREDEMTAREDALRALSGETSAVPGLLEDGANMAQDAASVVASGAMNMLGAVGSMLGGGAEPEEEEEEDAAEEEEEVEEEEEDDLEAQEAAKRERENKQVKKLMRLYTITKEDLEMFAGQRSLSELKSTAKQLMDRSDPDMKLKSEGATVNTKALADRVRVLHALSGGDKFYKDFMKLMNSKNMVRAVNVTLPVDEISTEDINATPAESIHELAGLLQNVRENFDAFPEPPNSGPKVRALYWRLVDLSLLAHFNNVEFTEMYNTVKNFTEAEVDEVFPDASVDDIMNFDDKTMRDRLT